MPAEVDVAVTQVVATAPATAITGQSAKAQIVVGIQNLGQVNVSTRANIDLFLSLDHSLGDDDPLVLTKPVAVRLKPGQARDLVVRLRTMPVVPGGEYHFLTRLTLGPNVVDLDTSNNAGGDSNTHVELAEPRIDLSGAFQTTPPSVKPGQTLKLLLTIFNSANVTAAGQLSVAVSATTDKTVDPVGQPVGTGRTRISVPPDEIRTYKLKLRVPSVFAAGSYYLLGNLDVDGAFAETNEANNPFPGFSTIQIG